MMMMMKQLDYKLYTKRDNVWGDETVRRRKDDGEYL